MALCLSELLPARAAAQGEDPAFLLGDDSFRVVFHPHTGALSKLVNEGWAIQRRPELGVSFRMHVPLPDRRDNFVLGQKQTLSGISRVGRNVMQLTWDRLESEHGGTLPVQLMAAVTLDDSGLHFQGNLKNDSDLVIESIEFPYLGDLQAPTPDAPIWRRQIWYENFQSEEIHPHFNNAIWGYWGFPSPMQSGGSSSSLFTLIESNDHGLYAGVQDPTAKYLVQYTFEQKPGVLESIHNQVPVQESISGIPAHLEFRFTHFVFAQPHTKIELSPTVLRPYRGDWHAGVDIYKEWRKSWFQSTAVPAWANQVHAWQEVQMNSPEDDLRFRYTDLVKIGEECAKNGVKAIQVVGWNNGGQDRNNPSLDIDPRLGTWQELHDSIARVQAMGVKIILFGKFVWADKSSQWYQRDLYRYAAKDPYGEAYENFGYGYTTPTQLAGIKTRRFAVMCTACEPYRKIALSEFKKVLALNADGFLFDEVCHHGPAKYCFAKDHGHPVPAISMAPIVNSRPTCIRLPRARSFSSPAKRRKTSSSRIIPSPTSASTVHAFPWAAISIPMRL